ncbi:ATP-grasp domain-containing protein [Anaerocolumna xylanovorans]|uniref:Gamma-F420-2:alpha-L-glutamate ligase n=1 Tax=Anaerocolumna xylanovorans DSM 12503 TaxID=1121345 RepID=A0A1M7YLP2_9FIRM|nr:ATP-grasp domain-containing protein [Anaerocolumna xylanovorans]SHO53518.1 gamma-F420-2:alpha-L-glutamate ligase [Anaerocolumna xylanovorans DSM 12503]
MTGWLIYGEKDAVKNKGYIEFYEKEGQAMGISVELILREYLEIGVKNNSWFIRYKGEECQKPDFAVVRTIYPLLSKQLECLSIPVFNSTVIARICNDKALTYQTVAALGIPIVDTTFVENALVLQRYQRITEPTVIKTVEGHGGSQVFLALPKASPGEKDIYQDFREVETKEEEILKGIASSDCVMQPLITGRHQDLRVYVIGKDIVTAILRTSREGFRANYSLGGEIGVYELSGKERSVAEKIIRHFSFGMVGIDFLIGEDGELIFNEIEDVVGARMLYQCTDINLVRRYLEFICQKCKSKTS